MDEAAQSGSAAARPAAGGAGVRVVHVDRDTLANRPVARAITTRGKELSVDDTVEAARRLFTRRAIRVVPVLDGPRYVGVVDPDALGPDVPGSALVGPLATTRVPTTTASTPTAEALATLDRDGGRRLVVLADDGSTYAGMVCLRGDRRRLCVDAASITPDRRSVSP